MPIKEPEYVIKAAEAYRLSLEQWYDAVKDDSEKRESMTTFLINNMGKTEEKVLFEYM